MIIAIDFDGVLFNDLRFKKEYEKIFRKSGVSRAAYQNTYITSKQKSGGYYEPKYQLQILKKEIPKLDIKRHWKVVDALVTTAPYYIYPDAKRFLSFFKENGASLFIVSTGDFMYYKKKVFASGIARYCKKVYIVKNVSKNRKLGEIIRSSKRDRIIFLDDKKRVIDEIKKEFPNVFAIQVRRVHTREKSARADIHVKNLDEAKKIISAFHES